MQLINVMGELIIEFANKQEWINKCPHWLPKKQSAAEIWLWIDKMGNVLTVGEDFESAVKFGTYPVKVYRLQRVSKVPVTPLKHNHDNKL